MLLYVYLGSIVIAVSVFLWICSSSERELKKLREKYVYEIRKEDSVYFTNTFSENDGKVHFFDQDNDEVILYNPTSIIKLHKN